MFQITPTENNSKVISSLPALPPDSHPSSLPSIPPVSADIRTEQGEDNFLAFWRENVTLSGGPRCSRQGSNGMEEKEWGRGGGGESLWRVLLTHLTFFLALFLHLFSIWFPSHRPTHAHTHAQLACNLLGLLVGLLCFPHSPPSTLQLAVCCLSEDWKN